MTRWARQRVADAAAGGERGASLVLALAFLTLFGVLLLALVGFLQAAVLANGRVHKQGLGQYAMAGAIDADIHRARKDPSMGVTTCDSLTYGSVSVACSVQRGDGGLRPGVGVPLNAILTVGGGITNNTAGSTMTVAGPVYANGPISLAANSILDVEDLPVTGTACGADTTNWKYSQPIVSCPPISGTAPPAGVGTAPAYASGLPDAALGTPIKPGDVACAGQYWDYKPGYYNDVNALMAPTATCSAKARYFGPGVYYFDFGRDCATTTSCSTQWSISGLPVIGGTATGWLASGSPPAAPTPTNPDATATACNPNSAGVQFVFGGASTAFVAAGTRVELCSGPGQILMYGQLSSPAATPQVLRPTGVSPFPPACPATVTPTDSPCWRNEGGGAFTVGRVLAIDGSRAQAMVPEPDRGTVGDPLTLTGFPAAPTTWGTNFDMAVSISHGELVTDAAGSTAQGNFTNSVAIIVTMASSAGTCQIDLMKFPQHVFNDGGRVDTFSKNADYQNKYGDCKAVVAQPFTVTYDPRFSSTGGQRDTILRSALDGIDVTFTPTLAYPRALDPRGIPVLDVASGAKFAAWGTVYMTNADFRVDTSGDVIFDRGVILKSLAANGGRAGVANFRLGGGRRTMLLEATSGSRRVKALVTVTDYDGPGYWARVKRWNVKR